MRDRDSIIAARNEDSDQNSRLRRNKRDDKIPFTPEVSDFFYYTITNFIKIFATVTLNL